MSGATVPVLDAYGKLGHVDASQVDQLPDGAKVLTPAEYAHAQKEEEYGGVKGNTEAAIGGLLRVPTLGASDALARHFGLGNELANAAEINPTTTALSEAGGLVGSAFIPGVGEEEAAAEGASVLGRAGRALTAPSRLVSELGGSIGEGVAGALTREGAGLAERAAVKGLSFGAQGAAEGALYGAGNSLSEASLGDTDVTAEKLLAGAKGGALMGLAGGGILGAGGEVIGTAAREAIERGSTLLGEKAGLGERLTSLANEESFKAVGGNKAIARDADNFFKGGVDELGARIRKEAEEAAGSRFAKLTADDLPGVAEKIAEKATGKIDQAISAIDDAASTTNQQPKLLEVLDGLRKEVVAPLGNGIAGISGAPGAKEVEAVIQRTLKARGLLDAEGALIPGAETHMVSFRDLRDIRSQYDALWKGSRATPIVGKPLQAARNYLEDQIMSRGEAIMEGVKPGTGKDVLGAYREGKELYQVKKYMDRAIANGSAGSASNRFVGMGEHLGGIAGGVVGGLPGAVVGGALGHLAKTRGAFVGADLAARAADTIRRIQSRTGSIDDAIGSGVRGFLSRARSTAVRGATSGGRGVQQRYQEQSTRVAALASNPSLHVDMAASRTHDMATHAPGTTASVASTSVRAAAYLQSQLPPGHVPANSLTPHLEKPRVSDAEAADWLRKAKVVEDPLSVVEGLKRGTVTRSEVDALQAVYPGLYAQVRQEVVEQLSDAKKPVGYAQRVQLGVLLRMPTDPTLAPDFLQAVAGAYATPGAGPAPQTSSPSPSPLGDSFQTDAERIAAKM